MVPFVAFGDFEKIMLTRCVHIGKIKCLSVAQICGKIYIYRQTKEVIPGAGERFAG